MRNLFFIFIISMLVFAGMQCSTVKLEYYVSQMGDDGNPGTKSKPFKSIQKINSLKLIPGTAIYFRGGEVFKGTLELTAEGSIEKPLIISSYDNEKANAIIDGGEKEAIIIKGDHFELKNINVKGAGRKDGNMTNGISIAASSYGLIENIRTEGFQKSGIEINSSRNIILRNVYAANNGFCGIYITGSDRKRSANIIIKDSHAENNPGDPSNFNNHSGNGILAGMSDTVLIDHCTATNNGWDMPRVGNGPVGIWAYESSYVTIQYCISYRNKTAKNAKDGGGFDLDGGVTHSVIQYCLSYENAGAGYGLFQYAGASLWHQDTVRYCLSINDAAVTEGSGGFFVWNGSNDSTQLADFVGYNNVVYAEHSPAIRFEPMSLNKNFSFYNNIFIGNASVIDGPASGEKMAGNIWWNAGKEITFRGYKDLAAWSAATGQEKWKGSMMGKQVDPLFNGPFIVDLTDPYKLHSLTGYQLKPGSSLKNNGLDLKALFGIPYPGADFFGNTVPQGKYSEPGIYEMKE